MDPELSTRWRSLYILALALASIIHWYAPGSTPPPTVINEPSSPLLVNTTGPLPSGPLQSLTPDDISRYKAASLEMFSFSFYNYMEYAFPRDDLRPISCRGSDSQGGIAITLFDSLDMLLLVDDLPALRKAVHWISKNSPFDVDVRVHVFEVTIRALGGLVSTHAMLEKDPHLVPGYDGALLTSAVDLADRLLPAFDTPTGLPTSWINLKKGLVRGDTRVTCTACAGTLLLEFGVLSRLTGNPVYEAKARHAIEYLWAKRSARGLVGTSINVDTGEWVHHASGVGAGIDSFYEYLLKAYLAFGDATYLDMFAQAYASAEAHMTLSSSINGVSWPISVHMTTGRILHPFVSSLSAFWPGMQTLTGQVAEAAVLHGNWMSAWERFKWTPEMFHMYIQKIHPTNVGYPLRPELVESTYMLYGATGDESFLLSAAAMQTKILETTRAKCGFASVADVNTGRLEDTMESFFLTETAKYFYLLFANATGLVEHYVLSTEAHPMPVFPSAVAAAAGQEEKEKKEERMHIQNGSSTTTKSSSSISTSSTASSASNTTAELAASIEDKCAFLCKHMEDSEYESDAAALHAALPRLPVDTTAAQRLRHRRCEACRVVTSATSAAAKKARLMWRAAADLPKSAGKPHVAPQQWSLSRHTAAPHARQFLCMLALDKRGKQMGCIHFREVAVEDLTSQSVQALPENAMFLQVTNATTDPTLTVECLAPSLMEVEIENISGEERKIEEESGNAQKESCIKSSIPAMLAQFGPDLVVGCSSNASPADKDKAWTAYKLLIEDSQTPKVEIEIPEDVEPMEEMEESQEEINQRIEMAAKAEKLGMSVSNSDASGKSGANNKKPSSQQQKAEDEDEYIDPDDLEDAVQESSSTAGRKEENTDSCTNPSTDSTDESSGEPKAQEQREEEDVDSMQLVAVCDASGVLVITEPRDACSPLTNFENLRGAIAVVVRGGCSFQSKAATVEMAGAVGVVIVNNDDAMLYGMAGDPLQTAPKIPAVMVRGQDGPAVLQAAEQGKQAKLRSPVMPKKIELAQRVLDDEEKRVALSAQAASEEKKEKKAMDNKSEATCTLPTEEGLGQSEATCTEPKEQEEEAASKEPAVQLAVEMVLPPNSQVWVLHHMYQKNVDFSPALESVSEIFK